MRKSSSQHHRLLDLIISKSLPGHLLVPGWQIEAFAFSSCFFLFFCHSKVHNVICPKTKKRAPRNQTRNDIETGESILRATSMLNLNFFHKK